MPGNSNLHDSSRNKQDEFYTNLQLVEDELKHYRPHFRGKRVLCNCDDPYESNFFKYFAMSFNSLGLKSLTATCYATSPVVYTQLDLFGEDKQTDLLRPNGLRDSENVSAVRREQIRLLKPRSIEMNSKMKIEEHKIPVREVFDGYVDSAELGVRGYGGKLNIRPAFQREFVYKPAQRDAVIETVRQGFPLNVMYWVRNGEGGFEMLDGQQRTLSICQYVNNEFSIDHHKFENLTKEEQEDILNYELTIYICEGEEREKLKWFEVVNTAGEQLNAQERRNAQYTGKWLYEAKKRFSKTGCAAAAIGDRLLNGSAIRQDFLETALAWIADRDGGDILDYMSAHQHDEDCAEALIAFLGGASNE